jgi:23S rRNA pseudouridine1911/1915/1917 synthase
VSELRVDAADVGTRTDVLLTRITGLSRNYVASAIKAGSVNVNGTVAKPSRILEPPPAYDVLPQAIPLDVVYEDDAVIVVNKPAGLVSHPAHGSPDGTLVNALLAHLGTLPGEPIRGGLVHRLDRDTSGLLVAAKTEASLTTLGRAMQKRYITREYRGLVEGVLREPAGTIRGALGRDARNRMRYAIRSDGKPAITHYALREQMRAGAELSFRLETGRTHQIRVHLAALGHPIVNDPLYGRPDSRLALPGQALHAWKLAFKHPVTKAQLAFEVEPPPDYLAALTFLRG